MPELPIKLSPRVLRDSNSVVVDRRPEAYVFGGKNWIDEGTCRPSARNATLTGAITGFWPSASFDNPVKPVATTAVMRCAAGERRKQK